MKKVFLLLTGALMAVGCYTQAELDEHRDTYNALAVQKDNQIAAANQAISNLEDQLEDALESAAQDAAMYQSIIDAANLEIAGLDADNAAQAQQIAELKVVISDAEAAIAILEAANADLLEQVEELTSDLAAARTLLRNRPTVTVTQFVDVVRTVIQTQEVLVEGTFSQADLDAAAANSNAASSTIADLNETISGLNARIAELELVIPEDGVTQADLDELQILLNDCRSALQLARDNSADEDRIAELEALEETLNDRITELEGQLAGALAGTDYANFDGVDFGPAFVAQTADFPQSRTGVLVVVGSADATPPSLTESRTITVSSSVVTQYYFGGDLNNIDASRIGADVNAAAQAFANERNVNINIYSRTVTTYTASNGLGSHDVESSWSATGTVLTPVVADPADTLSDWSYTSGLNEAAWIAGEFDFGASAGASVLAERTRTVIVNGVADATPPAGALSEEKDITNTYVAPVADPADTLSAWSYNRNGFDQSHWDAGEFDFGASSGGATVTITRTRTVIVNGDEDATPPSGDLTQDKQITNTYVAPDAADTLSAWSSWSVIASDASAPSTQQQITEERTRTVVVNGVADATPPSGVLRETRLVANPAYQAPATWTESNGVWSHPSFSGSYTTPVETTVPFLGVVWRTVVTDGSGAETTIDGVDSADAHSQAQDELDG